MDYEYGFPYPVTLESGEYFPDSEGDTETYEVLASHSTVPGCLFVATRGTDEAGNLINVLHETHSNRPGRWFATGRSRFLVEGGPLANCVLWVRSAISLSLIHI